MKILFIAPYLPSSLRIRPYRFIQYLSKNHEITFVGIIQPRWTSRFIDELKPLCKEIYAVDLIRSSCVLNSLSAVFTTKPMSVAYFSSSRMKSIINQLNKKNKYDIIHTEFIRAAPYTANLLGTAKLFDSVDSLSLAYKRGWQNRNGSTVNRIIALEEWIKMRHYEPRMMQSFDQVVVCSPIDQKYLNSIAISSPPVQLLPNGVDHEYYYWDKQMRDINTIVFVGQMNYYVNVDSIVNFYNHTFPLIQEHLPKINLLIVGADPKKSIRKLAQDPAVEVTGYVPDIRPYLAKASIFVCPLSCGSGIQNKVLHAMAMGTPIVTTSIAIQALNVKDNEHVLVADDSKKFAESVVSLIVDFNLRKRLSENSRNYVLEHHDWNEIGKNLENIYSNIIL